MAKRSMRKKHPVSNETTTIESQKSFEAFQDALYTILRLRAALNALPWPDVGSDRKFAEDAISELICTVGSRRDYYESMLIEAGGTPPTYAEWPAPRCALLPICVGDRIHAWRYHDSETEGVVVEVASRGVFVKADDDGKIFAVPWCEVSWLSIDCAMVTRR